jgi:hypothetical protein
LSTETHLDLDHEFYLGVNQIRLAIVVVLIASAGFATIVLTRDLIIGSAAITNSAPELLRASALVWVALVISFAFLYWELDLGGPGERAHNERRYPDLAFPEELSPEVCPPGWRPVFVDYLYLGVTNGVAFSPTDVMPLPIGRNSQWLSSRSLLSHSSDWW